MTFCMCLDILDEAHQLVPLFDAQIIFEFVNH